MALTIGTITHKSPKVLQPNFVVFTTIALDADYPGTEGGYDLDAVLDVPDKMANYEVLHVAVMPDGTYDFFYDHVTKLLKVFVSATGVEVADAVDLVAVTGLQATIFAQ